MSASQNENFPEPELLEVPVSDGARISVHRYPAPQSPAPALLAMTPYRKERNRHSGPPIQRAGYDFFLADVRGFGGSAGPYHGLLSDREIQDGVELVEWIAKQTFCNGAVGLTGGSYCGANQILTAARKPRGLRFITPGIAFLDTYRDAYRRGGIRSHSLWGAGTYLNSQHLETAKRGLAEFYLDLQLDPLDNARHRARSPESVLSKIDVPAFCIGGWHDYFLRSTVRAFQALKGPKRLMLGPWGHNDFDPGDAQLTWFNYWLRKEGSNPTEGNRVRLYMTGADEWRDLPDWFETRALDWWTWRPFTAETALRVVSCIGVVPLATNPKKQFATDASSGMGQWGEDATFDSEPFAENTAFGGPVGLETTLSVSGCEDVEVHARLSVVKADGACVQLTEGRLLASHRALDLERSELSAAGVPIVPWHTHDRYEPLAEGRPVTLHIEVYPVFHRFFRGERLRLGLTLVRGDEGAVPARAVLGAQTRVLLPRFAG